MASSKAGDSAVRLKVCDDKLPPRPAERYSTFSILPAGRGVGGEGISLRTILAEHYWAADRSRWEKRAAPGGWGANRRSNQQSPHGPSIPKVITRIWGYCAVTFPAASLSVHAFSDAKLGPRPRHPTMVSMWLLIFLMIAMSQAIRADESGELAIPSRGDLLILIGSPGTDAYQAEFQKWAEKWVAAADAGKVQITSLGMLSNDASLEKLRETLSGLSNEEKLPLWILLLGHGTYDGRATKFNLPGTDLEPEEFQNLLAPLQRPVAVIDCSSASAPFLEELARPQRVVITSTINGNEINFSHFGGYLAESINHPDADLDKDQQVSLLEAFLRATRLTEEFYAGDGRLATEHAAIDDNGDARAVPGNGFEGIRPIHRQEKSNLLPDGLLAHQWVLVPSAADAELSPEALARRNELELQISSLRHRKSELSEDDYYAALEPLFVELANLMRPQETPAASM